MPLNRARAAALVTAIVLAVGGWLIADPAAYADPDPDLVSDCINASATYKEFKECYVKAEKEARDEIDAKHAATTSTECLKVDGTWSDEQNSCS